MFNLVTPFQEQKAEICYLIETQTDRIDLFSLPKMVPLMEMHALVAQSDHHRSQFCSLHGNTVTFFLYELTPIKLVETKKATLDWSPRGIALMEVFFICYDDNTIVIYEKNSLEKVFCLELVQRIRRLQKSK